MYKSKTFSRQPKKMRLSLVFCYLDLVSLHSRTLPSGRLRRGVRACGPSLCCCLITFRYSFAASGGPSCSSSCFRERVFLNPRGSSATQRLDHTARTHLTSLECVVFHSERGTDCLGGVYQEHCVLLVLWDIGAR